MCPKTELKNILLDGQKSIETKSNEIKATCQQVLRKDGENKREIQSALDNLKLVENAIDFETPKLIKQAVLRQLDSIDMFLVHDLSQFEGLQTSHK